MHPAPQRVVSLVGVMQRAYEEKVRFGGGRFAVLDVGGVDDGGVRGGVSLCVDAPGPISLRAPCNFKRRK